ncbi:hypothetical protein [Aurantiacibacter gangjinensis]|nr:hypothetical protein [Aurantiacibacter gangjinensis]
MTDIAISGAMVAGFVAVHMLIHNMRFLDVDPRSGWLSFAGGVAVTYVFLHIMPDIAEHTEEFATGLMAGEETARTAVYGLTLAGLVTFYGLERLAGLREKQHGDDDMADTVSQYLHCIVYGLFNAVIGYLVAQREEKEGMTVLLFFIAMMLHFVTADFAKYQDDRKGYMAIGRWVLSAGAVLGWLLGITVQFDAVVVGCVFAFVAGGIILTVLKEELPEERKGRFFPFLGGVALFGALILAERHAF